MKIVNDLHSQFNNNPKQQEERQAPTEFHYVGSQKKVRGHILFSYNTKTKEIKPAEFKREVEIGMDGLPVYKTIAIQEKDCIYFQALNLKNAMKKINKKEKK